MTTGKKVTHHCRECGAQVEEFCADHPKAIVETIVSAEKKIAIKMSERSPVTIDAAEWPTIADVSRHDGAVRSQATNEWYVRVREHSDGRRIVYGEHSAGGGGQFADFRGSHAGFLLTFDGSHEQAGKLDVETIRAIRRVAGIIGDTKLGDECIADLPAGEI